MISKRFVEEHPDAYREFIMLVENAERVIEHDPSLVRSFYAKPEYGGFDQGVYRHFMFPALRSPDPELKNVA